MASRAFAHRSHGLAADPAPTINITPLIDVLLVLLIMMILTIPAMTHKVPIDLPQPGPASPELAVAHTIDMDATGALALDGKPVSDAALQARLAALRADPDNLFHLRIDPHARYERADQALATIKRAGVTRLGFVGNERFADFDRL